MLLNKDISYSDKGDEFENGKKIEIGDIKVVNLKGTWREMGRQYGHLMKKELEDLDTFLDLIIEANEGNASTARAIVDQQIAQTPYRINQFFEGASETSGFTVDELQIIADDYAVTRELMTDKDAKLITEFADKYKDILLIVHCDEGVSRSAGIAAAILRHYTGDDAQIFDNVFSYNPNMWCYFKVLKAFGDEI